MADIGQVCRRPVLSRFATPKSIKIVSDQVILSIDNGKRWKAIQRNLLVWISGIPLTLEDVWNSGWEIFYLRLYFSWYLPARTANVIKPNRFCYYVQKDHGFRDNFLSVIVSTFLISYLLISCWSSRVFSAVLFNLCQKTTMSDLPL